MGRDWLTFLDTEIARRDQRHAFLWAILLSLVAGLSYLGRWMLWNSPLLELWSILAAIAVGCAMFDLVVHGMVLRLIGALQPRQYHALPLRDALVIARLVAVRGVPLSARWSVVPAFVSTLICLVVGWLWSVRLGVLLPLVTLVTVLAFTLLWSAVGLLFFASRRTSASVVSGWALLDDESERARTSVIEASRAELELWAKGSWIGRTLSRLAVQVDGRREPSSKGRPSTTLPMAAVLLMRFIFWSGTTLMIYLPPTIAVLSLATTLWANHSAPVLAELLGIVALTLGILAVLRIGIHLYTSRTREMLEQLRLNSFVDELSDEELLKRHAIVHVLQESSLHFEADLAALVATVDTTRPAAPEQSQTPIIDGAST